MQTIRDFIRSKLGERAASNSLRVLQPEHPGLADFCSNDYLSFARSAELKKQIIRQLHAHPGYKTGSTGSRLLAGNDDFTEALEAEIAAFHGHEAALLFNSGYEANIGLLSVIAQRGDTIISDELIHASLIDGARLSHAARFRFKHNDIHDLENKLKKAGGKVFVVAESVYSMDGDEAPLEAFSRMCQHYGAALIVDEAHATGVFGESGRGLVHNYQLENRVLATVVTYGKALGASGAAVLGSAELKSYLVNFARPFIYTTAASFYTHLCIRMAYNYLQHKDHQSELAERIHYFKKLMGADERLLSSRSAIQSLLIGGNAATKQAAAYLQQLGMDVRPVLSPTVPSGTERLRICLHNHNTLQEIHSLTGHFQKL